MSVKETNDKFVKQMGNMGSQVKDFARIRSFGDKNSAITHDNVKVYRKSEIFCEGYGWVKTLPTANHFIFEDTSGKKGRWIYMCTCGGLGGIVSYEELKGLITMEQTGYVLACISALTAKQATGVYRHLDNSTD